MEVSRPKKTEDDGSKKFVVDRFLDFKMDDSITVINQVQEILVILHKIHTKGMNLKWNLPSNWYCWEATSYLEEFQELS